MSSTNDAWTLDAIDAMDARRMDAKTLDARR